MNTANIIELRPHQIEAYRNAHERDEVKVRSIPPLKRDALSHREISAVELFASAPRLMAKAIARGWAKLSTDKSPVRIPDKHVLGKAVRKNMSAARRTRSAATL